jgi:5-methylcytosine-specific restriction endonuclease McrA
MMSMDGSGVLTSPPTGVDTAHPSGDDRWQEIYRRGEGEFDPTLMAAAFKLEFAASPAFVKKLEEVKSLLSSRVPMGAGLEGIFEMLMNEFIDRHSPEKKAERRRKRQASAKSKSHPAPAHENDAQVQEHRVTSRPTTPKPTPPGSTKPQRHIPARVSDEVYMRDHGQCTFVGTTGVRCGSTRMLQLDHVVPFARGGNATPRNLRLLCAPHNLLEAERAFGRTHMRRFYPRK